ncbi:MAG: hypothetical protein IT221_15035 [Fluviicola sp.]|nr:hypothetical protein [Fluviicola sp.]
MNSTQDRIPVTPVLTTIEILPETPTCELPDPLDPSAEVVDGELTFNVSVLIPNEIAWEDVVVQQYYDDSKTNPLQFYFVYTLDGEPSGDTQYDLTISGLKNDASGKAIPYANIENLLNMVVNDDPKTSRGTVFPIRQSGNI